MSHISTLVFGKDIIFSSKTVQDLDKNVYILTSCAKETAEFYQLEILDKLSALASKDRVKTYVIGMTSLGLVEMTRAKIEKPLLEQVQQNC